MNEYEKHNKQNASLTKSIKYVLFEVVLLHGLPVMLDIIGLSCRFCHNDRLMMMLNIRIFA